MGTKCVLITNWDSKLENGGTGCGGTLWKSYSRMLIMYIEVPNRPKGERLSTVEFRISLSRSLINGFTSRCKTGPFNEVPQGLRRDQIGHFLVDCTAGPIQCVYCKEVGITKRKRSSYKCEKMQCCVVCDTLFQRFPRSFVFLMSKVDFFPLSFILCFHRGVKI